MENPRIKLLFEAGQLVILDTTLWDLIHTHV